MSEKIFVTHHQQPFGILAARAQPANHVLTPGRRSSQKSFIQPADIPKPAVLLDRPRKVFHPATLVLIRPHEVGCDELLERR
jgi:hypothetical protein